MALNFDFLSIRTIIHYSLHFSLPVIIAFAFFNNPKGKWYKAAIIMLLAMLIDLDHLFATPIFDANRCSIGFHFLHSYVAIIGYITLTAFSKTRVFGIGLLLHVLVDLLDCCLINKF